MLSPLLMLEKREASLTNVSWTLDENPFTYCDIPRKDSLHWINVNEVAV